MKVLVTGASGFIGSFLVEKGLELGYDVWAGIRRFPPEELAAGVSVRCGCFFRHGGHRSSR